MKQPAVATSLALILLSSAAPAPAQQEGRERADRGLKGALSSDELDDGEREAGFELIAAFLGAQVLRCERRDCPDSDEAVEDRLNEQLPIQLDEAGLPTRIQRRLLSLAQQRLTELADAAARREDGEAGLKAALEGSSLTENERVAALDDLMADAEHAGPGLMRAAEAAADEENANALPGQEVEADAAVPAVAHLAEAFRGRGLSSGELEELAAPFALLIEARSDMRDALRFARAPRR